MNKIPIKYAIDSGAWFTCESFLQTGWFFNKVDYTFNFKFRALSFNKISLDEIDEPEKIKIDEGVLYLLKIEAINLNKDVVSADSVSVSIVLIDQDDFVFERIDDFHLTEGSNFAKSTGLNRFSRLGNPLQPKIKVSGAVAFLLPDDEKAEYFISVGNGNIQEV